ncbi:MAG: DUF1294 domain-containing protein [Streptococcaceae bacterium]|jgi:uncharacterized membrane protein YsdA (DUF1294 family)|nr:DUF1294 domain-containing protein [Streptococcaceae bacterium]
MKIHLLALLLVWNLVVFAFYAVDKWKAIHHRWRIPEKVLLTMSYLGGGIGALLAGKLVHHKTRKWYFWTAWILGLFVDAALIYLISF